MTPTGMPGRGWVMAQFALAAAILAVSLVGVIGTVFFDAAELLFSFTGAIQAFAVFPGLVLSLVVNGLLMRAHRELGVSLTERWLLGLEFALAATLLVLHFWPDAADALGLAVYVWPVLVVVAVVIAIVAVVRNASRPVGTPAPPAPAPSAAATEIQP